MISPRNEELYGALLRSSRDEVADCLRSGTFDQHDDQLLISVIDAKCGETTICMLIKAGWNPNARDAQFRQTAIMWAAHRGLESVVASLIEHGGDVSASDDSGTTAALSACCEKSQQNVICLRLLIDRGIDVNQGSFHSPLMWAISDGTEQMVSMLLEAGADPNRFYGRGNALYAAIENNRPSVVPLLLRQGADPMVTIPTPWDPPEFSGLSLLEFAKRMKRPKIVAILEGRPIPVSSAKVVLLPSMWKQVEKKLRSLNVNPDEVLNPPADDSSIQLLESQWECSLPVAVRKSWTIHDGQPADAASFRLRNGVMEELAGEADLFRLIPVSEMLTERGRAAESYASLLEESGRFQAESGIEPVAWATSWLPLARNLAGDLLCCDLAPPSGGTVGQIVLVSSENPVRTRVAHDWCECFESVIHR